MLPGCLGPRSRDGEGQLGQGPFRPAMVSGPRPSGSLVRHMGGLSNTTPRPELALGIYLQREGFRRLRCDAITSPAPPASGATQV
jgi:hypothetical protein